MPKIGDTREPSQTVRSPNQIRAAQYPLVVTRPVERGSVVMIRGAFSPEFANDLVDEIARVAGHRQFVLMVAADGSDVFVVAPEVVE